MPTLVARLPPLSLSPNSGLKAADSMIKPQRPKMVLQAPLVTGVSAVPTFRSLSIVQIAKAVLK